MRRIFNYLLLIVALLVVAETASAQRKVFTPQCSGNAAADTAKIAAILASTGSNEITIHVPYKTNTAQSCTITGTITWPVRVMIDNSDGGRFIATAGSTITVQGPVLNLPGRALFTGPGAWILTGTFFVGSDDSRLQVATSSGPGLVPTLPSDPSKCLVGTGVFIACPGGGGPGSGISTLNGESGPAVAIGSSTNISIAASSNVVTPTLIGPIADGLLTSNVPLKNGTNAFTGTNTFDPMSATFKATPVTGTAFKIQDLSLNTITVGLPTPSFTGYQLNLPANGASAAAGTFLMVQSTGSGVLTTNFLPQPLVPVTAGGTGLTSLTANALLIGNGTSNVGGISPGSAGLPLVSSGSAWSAGLLTLTGINPSILSGNGSKIGTISGTTSSGKCLEWDGAGNIVTAASNAACGAGGGGGGGVSSASNVGTGGVGVFNALVSADLQFKNLRAVSTKISVVNNSGLNTVDVDVPDAGTLQKGAVAVSTTPSGTPTAVETGDPRVPTQGENDALIGTSGSPGTSNPFVTKQDPLVNENRALGEFASFGSAITAIGSTATTLVIPTSTTVSSNVTVPATLNLDFTGGGQLSISSGVVVTITDGTKIIAPPTRQIFAGAGTVKFNGTYPEWFHPGWWGAAMDDTGSSGTDDLAAFNAMQTSMQRTAVLGLNTTYVGGKIKLPDGRASFMSDTLRIRRPLTMEGSDGDYDQHSFAFRFAAGKTGFIVDGLSTLDGLNQTLQQGAFSSFKGFRVYGGGTTTSNNTILSINGLTATLTGGSITSVARNGNAGGTIPAIAPGSTVRINGYNWVVADTLSATATATIPLAAPRIFVTANGTSTISEGTGGVITFPSANDWVGKAIQCQVDQGAALYSFTISSMTTSTLVLNTTLATGNYTCTVTGGSVSQTGVAARLNIYHGFDVRMLSKYKNISVSNFAGNGWQCHSEQLPYYAPFQGAEPNCNNSWLERVHSNFNAGSGVLLWGINANNIETHSLNIENNKGFGLFEQSLGSNHYSFHIAFNGQGAFKTGFGAGQSRIDSSYTEGVQPSAMLGQSASATGNFGSGFDLNNGYANWLKADSYGQMASDSGLAFRHQRGSYFGIDNPKAVGAFLGTANQPNTMGGFGAAEETYNLVSGGTADVVVKPVYLLGYNQLATGWYSWYYGGNPTTDQANSVFAVSGSQAAVGGGKVSLPNGVGIGTLNPLYRTHILGANSAPSLSAVSGIMAIDAGTNSNQLVFGGYSSSPFGFWIQTKDNTSGGGTGSAYPLALNPLGGAVRGLFQDKGGAVYNCKSYGALGDGSTDDATTLGTCISTAIAAGGSAFIPPGTYIVGSTISVSTSYSRIVGAGKGLTVLKRKNSGGTFDLLSISGAKSSVSNLTVDGNHANNGGATGLDIAVTGPDVDINDVEVINSEYISIATSGARTKIRNCVLTGVGSTTVGAQWGVWADSEFGTDGLTVLDSKISDYLTNGIIISSAYVSVTNATNATPIVITLGSSVGWATGTQVTVQGVKGNTAANGTWIVTRTNGTTFSLDGSVGSGAYTSGGAAGKATGDRSLISRNIISNNNLVGGAGQVDIRTFVIFTDNRVINTPTTSYGIEAQGGGIFTGNRIEVGTAASNRSAMEIQGGFHYLVANNIGIGFSGSLHIDESIGPTDYIHAYHNDWSQNPTGYDGAGSTGTHNFLASPISEIALGASVASASTIVPTGRTFPVTGTATISTITVTADITVGTAINMITAAAAVFDEAGNIDVTGATSLTSAAGNLVFAVWDGTKWRLR